MKLKFIILVVAFLTSVSTLTALSNSEIKHLKKTPETTNQDNPPKIEGYFYLNPVDGAIYWYVNGYLHHVQDPATYHTIFKNPNDYLLTIVHFQSFSWVGQPMLPEITIIGRSIPSGSRIIKHGVDIYLSLNWYTNFYIPNPETFVGYHLNWDTLQTVATKPGGIIPFRDFKKDLY